MIADTRFDFICECPSGDTEGRLPFLVTGVEGETSCCLYCEACSELAAMNWTGEIASIEPLNEEVGHKVSTQV